MNLLKSSILTTALLAASLSYAQEPITFNRYCSDNTLRLDYIFSGNHDEQHIAVDELCRTAGWAGRHTRLDSVPISSSRHTVSIHLLPLRPTDTTHWRQAQLSRSLLTR